MTQLERQFSLRVAFIAAMVAALVTLFRIPGDRLWEFLERDRTSLASILTELTFVVTLLATMLSYRRFTTPEETQDHLNELSPLLVWLVRVSVAFATAVTTGLAAAFLFGFVAAVFEPAALHPLVAVAIATAYSGVLAYAVVASTLKIGSFRLLVLAGLVMVIGLSLAIMLSSSVDWWTRAISFLGVDQHGYIFNFTFVVAGMILLAVMQDKLGDLDVLRLRGTFTAPSFPYFHDGVIWFCLLVAGIGLFPFEGITRDLHQIVSTGAMVLFMALALISSYAMPIYNQTYRMMTNVIVGMALTAVLAHFVFGFVNFSQMELALLILAAMWIVTFYVYSRGYVARHDPTLITGRVLRVRTL